MATQNPSSRGQRALGTLSAATLILAAGMLTAYWLYGHRVLLRAALGPKGEGGFSRAMPFALQDSLPALEGGLTNLEAFKATMAPSWKANRERSIWASDSLGTIILEFLTQRDRIDSVSLLIWSDGNPLRVRTVRNSRSATWTYTPRRAVTTWTEVVTAYLSHPPLFELGISDNSVKAFSQAEGKVFHVVNSWYLNRREPLLKPDTSYPVDARYQNAEPLRLLARGGALAVINASKRAVRLRLTGLDSHSTTHTALVMVDSSQVAVYRTILKERTGHVMAYTEPGGAYPVFRGTAPEPQRFFVLMR